MLKKIFRMLRTKIERKSAPMVEKVVRVPDFFSHFIIFVLFDDILDDPQSYFRCANRKMSGGVPD